MCSRVVPLIPRKAQSNSRNLDGAGLDLDNEEDHAADGSTQTEDFHAEEVTCVQRISVHLDELVRTSTTKRVPFMASPTLPHAAAQGSRHIRPSPTNQLLPMARAARTSLLAKLGRRFVLTGVPGFAGTGASQRGTVAAHAGGARVPIPDRRDRRR